MSKIIELRAENTKRLTAVTIHPDGSLVIVGGLNGAGKSSVLDSIAMALGGERLVPAEPIRRGAKKAFAQVKLDDGIVVRRTFTAAGGGTLTVSTAEGAKFPSPQKLLDGLVGRLSFDPLAFASMEPRKQAETLRDLVGIDFTAQDRSRKLAFDARAEANREVKRIEGAISRLPPAVPGTPGEPQSVDGLSAELSRRHAANVALENARKRLEALRAQAIAKKKQIVELEDGLARERAALEKITEDGTASAEKVAAMRPADEDEVLGQIKNIEQINSAVRSAVERREWEAEATAKQAEAAALTEEIERIDAAKAASLSAAKFPVPGLAFGEEGVTLQGLPLEQASSAEMLRVSVAMGLAMNPKLRVILIRDGSLLDENNLALIAEMAEAADAQIWLEKVSTGKECSVVISEGAVVGANEDRD